MASLLSNLFGGNKPASNPPKASVLDSDFADFAQPADPLQVPFPPAYTPIGSDPQVTTRPFTAWYDVHKRHSLGDFRAEGIILVFITALVTFHLIGASLNRDKAKKWMEAHKTALTSEFALVGLAGVPPSAADQTGPELVQTLEQVNKARGVALLKEKSLFEFATYATGRENVAFIDVRLTLVKRFNAIMTMVEYVMGFFFESMGQPTDSAEAVLYPFDGKEALTVPGMPGASELRNKDGKSSFDGFVWALVNKDRMKQIREDRFDISRTTTKDHPNLPPWLTVMSENAEVTNMMLTPELIRVAESAGIESFESLVVTDHPTEQPKTLEELTWRKRLFLRYRLPRNNDYEPLVPMFKYFLRLPDHLVQSGRFRPEVQRKLQARREELQKQMKKAGEDEKAEERAIEREKTKKAKRDKELSALDAKAQKKYLEKEREKELRRHSKKQTTRP